MSRIMREVAAAYSRWRQMNPEDPPPSVRVLLRGGAEHLLTGIAVHPSLDDRGAVALSPAGAPLPIIVLLDDDIDRVEIGIGPSSKPLGFRPLT